MKKFPLFLVAMALMAVIGVPNLAAQQWVNPNPNPDKAFDSFDELVDGFNAVPTLSTESRYSAGIFSSSVDDFIDVNSFDPAIGTFFFLGGFPSDGTTVEKTDYITDPYLISAGFAKSFSKFYLGVYFGGNIVEAAGWDDQGDNVYSSNGKTGSWATATWKAKLAVLFGTEKIGGIRLDMVMDDVTDTTSYYGGKNVGTGANPSGEGIALALSWGKVMALGGKELPLHAKLGYKFADYELSTDAEGGNKTETYTNAAWLLNAGTAYALNDISTLEGDLYLGGNFGTLATGENSGTIQGDFGIKLEVALANAISPVEGLEIGFSPNLGIGVWGADPNTTGDYGNNNAVTNTDFELALGVDAGIKARLPGKFNKFTLITGAGINIFDWYVSGNSGGETNLKGNSQWRIDGLGWNPETLTATGSLGIGTVFAPNDNLSVGFGLSGLLDSLVKVNLVEMSIKPGDFFTTDQPGLNGGRNGIFGGLFKTAVLDLTVSYRF
jgi:hypothetical protein